MSNSITKEHFLRLPQVLEMFACSKSHVWLKVKNGGFPSPHKWEGITVWKYSELKEYMDKIVMEGNHNE